MQVWTMHNVCRYALIMVNGYTVMFDLANRYADVVHGCGLGVEYPFIWYPEDAEYGAYDGVFEENMIVCVESYVGAAGGSQGVKLEQPVLISADGPRILSTCTLEDDYA